MNNLTTWQPLCEAGVEAAKSPSALDSAPWPMETAHHYYQLVYNDLERAAAHRLAVFGSSLSLQPADLVHETWLRLVRAGQHAWTSRGQFFAAALEAMRRVVVDQIRGHHRIKRGGGQPHLDIDCVELSTPCPNERILLLEEALQALEEAHPEKARVVILKFFGGFTDSEAAERLHVTERTIERHWAYAKAWLVRYCREVSQEAH